LRNALPERATISVEVDHDQLTVTTHA
jgi:hypothetical protein